MNVAEPCLICQKNCLCECRSSLASFFNILKNANDRVLRVEPSSVREHPKVIGAGIDKLNAYFPKPIPIDFVRAEGRRLGYTMKRVFLKDRKPYLAVSSILTQIHLKLSFGDSEATGLVSNPNKFMNWKSYYTFISSLIPNDSLYNAQVTRLDLNLDFACSYPSLIQMLDVKNKRSALSFIDESGCRTGLIIGKGNEKIEIYDKARKDKLSDQFTRIELRLGKSKLPTRTISDIPQLVTDGSYFEGLVGLHTQFTEAFRTADQSQRLVTFKYNLERDGFYSAKKTMNLSRNFDRDFAKLIKIENWTIQPSQLFKTKIKTFIQPEEERIWMH